MTWDLDSSFDPLAHASAFPAWLAVCAAAFFGLLFLLSLARAERTVANGALAALTFSGLAIAAAVGLRTPDSAPQNVASPALAVVPALACIDDLAGETTLAACEKVLFSAPDTVAAAVAYTATRINKLVAFGNPSAATRPMSPDAQALRNAVERDRYGLVAYVLATRDRCQPSECAAYSAMIDRAQIASNMEGLIYEGLVAKYAPTWAANASSTGVVALAPSGRPSTVDFPTASSIPPVNIMTTEPPFARPEPPPPAQLQAAAPPPAAQPSSGEGGPYVPARTAAAPKKRAPAKRAAPAPSAAEPVQIAPTIAEQ